MSESSAHPSRFSVEACGSSLRLDVFLTGKLSGASRARVRNWIDRGLVRVDGLEAKASLKLKSGQVVEVIIPEPEPTHLVPDRSVAFAVLFEDDDVIVIDKPPGLVVHPAAGHWSGTLVHGLLSLHADLPGIGGAIRPGIVHRLDRDTSGVMVVAKSESALAALSQAFKGREVRKTYLALSVGSPKNEKGEIDAPIGRHPVRRKEMSVRSPKGRPARTLWEVRARHGAGTVLLSVRILTGRTHQIRVHLASIGLPILGDPVYGKGTQALKKGAEAIRGLVRRQMLHAQRLEFNHPVTGNPLDFSAPLPADMMEIIGILEDSSG